MDYGIALPTPASSWKMVKRAEDAGFRTAWFYDTQILSADVLVAMGAAAVKPRAPSQARLWAQRLIERSRRL